MKTAAQQPSSIAGYCGPLVPRRFAFVYLALEFTVLFAAVPGVIFYHRHFLGTILIPFILAAAGICLALLLADRDFKRKSLLDADRLRPRLQQLLLVFIPWAAALSLAWALHRPSLLFAFPKADPTAWAAVMVLYPILSAYPQEIIFRTFLFHRYRVLFPSPSARIVVSALAFGAAHLFFANWIAPTLSAIGGLLIAYVYAKTQSTLQATILHGLWGNLVFTIGMGRYFFGGAIS